MGTIALIVGFSAWVIAAVGAVMAATGFFGVASLAPAGQKLAAATDLAMLNFPAVKQRLGDAAVPMISRYRRGGGLFISACVLFFAALILNIASGNAA